MNVILKLKNLKNVKACKSWKKPIDINCDNSLSLANERENQSAEQEEF